MRRIYLATLSLWLLLWAVGCAQTSTGPDSIVEELLRTYVRGFNNRDAQELAAYFDLTDADAQQTLQTAEASIQTAEPGVTMQVEQIIIKDVQITGNESVVRYQLQLKSFRDGAELSSDIVSQDLGLKLVNGDWKVSGGDLPTIKTGT